MIIKEKHQKIESLLTNFIKLSQMIDKWISNHPDYSIVFEQVTIGDEKTNTLHTLEIICKKDLYE